MKPSTIVWLVVVGVGFFVAFLVSQYRFNNELLAAAQQLEGRRGRVSDSPAVNTVDELAELHIEVAMLKEQIARQQKAETPDGSNELKEQIAALREDLKRHQKVLELLVYRVRREDREKFYQSDESLPADEADWPGNEMLSILKYDGEPIGGK